VHLHSTSFHSFIEASQLYIALKRIMETEGMELEIIINPKVNDDGHDVVQV